MAAIATDDVWGVGGHGGESEPNRIRMLHWDGTRWRKVHAPNPGMEDNRLWAVSATGPDDGTLAEKPWRSNRCPEPDYVRE